MRVTVSTREIEGFGFVAYYAPTQWVGDDPVNDPRSRSGITTKANLDTFLSTGNVAALDPPRVGSGVVEMHDPTLLEALLRQGFDALIGGDSHLDGWHAAAAIDQGKEVSLLVVNHEERTVRTPSGELIPTGMPFHVGTETFSSDQYDIKATRERFDLDARIQNLTQEKGHWATGDEKVDFLVGVCVLPSQEYRQVVDVILSGDDKEFGVDHAAFFQAVWELDLFGLRADGIARFPNRKNHTRYLSWEEAQGD